jgi:hypothetical protein
MLLLAASAGMLPSLVLGLMGAAELRHGGLVNPDSAMRMVRLNDIVATGQPLHAVLRDASGAGAVMSWSHFMDSLLLLLAAPLAVLTGWPAALHAAALAWSPLCMAGLGVAAAWAAAPVATRVTLWTAALAAGTAPAILTYGLPGTVHHHVPLLVTAVMAWGWALRLLRGASPLSGGIALGAWTAAGLWLSPEALPFALLATGALWLEWLRTGRRGHSRALATSAATLAALATLAWLVDPPAAGLWAIEPDRISLPFVLLAIGAAIASGIGLGGLGRPAALAAAAIAAVLWLCAFPHVLHGTAGLMDPAQAEAFFGRIAEMQPVNTLETAFVTLTGGTFALAGLLLLATRLRPAAPLLYAAACTAGMLALAALHVRFAAYPAIAGALVLPAMLSRIDASRIAAAFQSLARIACLGGLLGTPALAPLAAVAATPKSTAHACALDGAVALLQGHDGAVVLADINDGPGLLYRTRARIVGSLYHRNIDGFMRLRAAWRDTPAAEPNPTLRDTRATLVLACPGEARSMLLDGLPETTLLDRLDANQPPPWLHPIADAGPGGYVLYEIQQ